MTMRIPGHHTTPVPIMSDTNNSAGQHPTRARSRSRYSSTLSSLLVLASDRLDVEIRRADAADRRAADYLARLRTALQQKDTAEFEVARITEQLHLYKVQLDIAQKEIFRAQEIVQRIELDRHEAEEEAVKARSVARKFQQEWAVMIAREDGRLQGFNDGLRRGRRVGFEEGRAAGYEDGQEDLRQDEHNYYDQQPPAPDPSPPRVIIPPAPPSEHRSHHDNDDSIPITHEQSHHVPDTAPFAPILPVPTVTTPFSSLHQSVPLAVPSPSSSPDLTRRRSRPPSPAPSSTDGWIPVADSNSMFDIPPPHVLSNPAIAATAASHSLSTSRPPDAPPPDSDSAYNPRVHVRDYADAPSRPHSSAAASRSTRLSNYDIIGPPREPWTHSSQPPSERSAHSHDSHDRANATAAQQPHERTQPEQIAEEWRLANTPVIVNTVHTIPHDLPAPTHTRTDATQNLPRGTVHIPSPTIVSKRIAAIENPPPAPKPERPHSPLLDRLFGQKKRKPLSRGPSNTSTVPEIHIDSPVTYPLFSPCNLLTHPHQSTSASTTPDKTRTAHLLTPDTAHHIRPLEPGPTSTPISGPPASADIYAPPFIGPAPSQSPVSAAAGPTSGPAGTPFSPRTAKSPYYEVAPIPAGVTYPDPPTRRRRRAGGTGTGSNGGSGESISPAAVFMSPAPLNRPISLFSDRD
jgi:hypothetical protein